MTDLFVLDQLERQIHQYPFNPSKIKLLLAINTLRNFVLETEQLRRDIVESRYWNWKNVRMQGDYDFGTVSRPMGPGCSTGTMPSKSGSTQTENQGR